MKYTSVLPVFCMAAFAFLFLASCESGNTPATPSDPQSEAQQQIPDAHGSRESLDWEGTYQGVLPCADCQGIEIALHLQSGQEYQQWSKYIGKQDTVLYRKGSFTWDAAGNVITISDGQETSLYQVGENRLTTLDQSGNKITGALADNYILHKVENNITEKYWKLTELRGKPVSGNFNREPHIILKLKDNRLTGSGGCNTLNGQYSLEDSNHVKFSQIITTRMACPEMQVEDEMLKVLQEADGYQLHDDALILNKAGSTLLARFEVVYLR